MLWFQTFLKYNKLKLNSLTIFSFRGKFKINVNNFHMTLNRFDLNLVRYRCLERSWWIFFWLLFQSLKNFLKLLSSKHWKWNFECFPQLIVTIVYPKDRLHPIPRCKAKSIWMGESLFVRYLIKIVLQIYYVII